MATSFLQQPIEKLHMVGDQYAKRLHKLDLFTVNDLLHHFPFRYEDRTLSQGLEHVSDGDVVTLTGSIVSIKSIRTRNGKQIQKASFVASSDDVIEVVWFNQPYLVKTLSQNPQVTLSGKAKLFRGQWSLQSPSYELVRNPSLDVPGSTPEAQPIGSPKTTIHTDRLVPIYHLTAGVSSKWLRSRIAALLKPSIHFEDWLPQEILEQEGLIDLSSALRSIHFPPDETAQSAAKQRLSFNELFLWQLRAQISKQAWQQKNVGYQLEITPHMIEEFLQHVPFTLTAAQQRALGHIVEDLQQTTPMNRLMQGDVGSGKTVVAAVALYCSVKNGLPAVLMAPTEILALQHAATLEPLCQQLGMTLSVHTRSRHSLDKTAQVFVGTHALLHRNLPSNIGVLVIDEQHRFGVAQRAQLLQQKVTPNVLSMTATPIPRTIALTLYADLDVSVIDELPPGRKPVKTWVVPPAKRVGAYDWIRKQIQDHGSQAFVVCPLIEDSEHPQMAEVKAAESEFEHLKTQIFPDLKLGLVHGKMKAAEKNATIQAFRDKQFDILVATPVIEVGIDIPNATIMLIEGAERFGLAALHQLRGRVGRGDQNSYCLLFSSNPSGSKRLKHLETIASGFELAELDLKLRGSGEVYGTKQSGHINLKIASFGDQRLIAATHRHATELMKLDPELKHYPLLKAQLEDLLEKGVAAN